VSWWSVSEQSLPTDQKQTLRHSLNYFVSAARALQGQAFWLSLS
jgi:hypothetical protein